MSTCTAAEFIDTKPRKLRILLFVIKLSKTILLKSKIGINRTFSQKNCLIFLKLFSMRTEEHFGQFVLRNTIPSPKKVFRHFPGQKIEILFKFCAQVFWLVFINRFLRTLIIKLGRNGTLKTSEQFPGNEKVASYVFVGLFRSTPEWGYGQHMIHNSRRNENKSFFVLVFLVASHWRTYIKGCGCLFNHTADVHLLTEYCFEGSKLSTKTLIVLFNSFQWKPLIHFSLTIVRKWTETVLNWFA